MIKFWELTAIAMLIALPLIAVASWGMSKLLVKPPPNWLWLKKLRGDSSAAEVREDKSAIRALKDKP